LSLHALVLALLACVVTAFAGASLFLLAHGIWLGLYRRWSGPRLAAAYASVNAIVMGGGDRARDSGALERLPGRLRARVLVELSRRVSGESRLRLSRLAAELGVLEHARRRLRSPFWWRRLLATRTLQSLDAEGSPFLPLLDDPHPAVRAQAAEWAAEEPAPATAEALISLLERDDTLPRFTAQDSLLRLGTLAVPTIAGYLAAGRGAGVIPAMAVAIALAQPAFAAPALAHCASRMPEVRRLAAELLGRIGGREGTDALTGLLTDSDPLVRAAAARALGRIGHWPAAAAVAELLRDSEWEVRQAAGFSLRSLGSPGLLMLRRYRGDSDRYAADMARQVLEIPAAVEAPG
jgi:hypothetical protein